MTEPELHDSQPQEQEEELFEHYRYVVDAGQSMLRIDKYLSARIENVSRTRVQTAAQAGNILVNENPVKPNYRVKPLDVIQILLPNPPREIELIPQDLPINVVYEDDDVIVVDKQAGMVVHPAYGNYSGTLMNALMYHFRRAPTDFGTASKAWCTASTRTHQDCSSLPRTNMPTINLPGSSSTVPPDAVTWPWYGARLTPGKAPSPAM